MTRKDTENVLIGECDDVQILDKNKNLSPKRSRRLESGYITCKC